MEGSMSDNFKFSWPRESILIERAERALNIVRPTAPRLPAAVTVEQAIAEMVSRLGALEESSRGVVPPGYESGGHLVGLKRLLKKVSRRLVWWYVEPRWTVQREITTELTAFARSSIQANQALAAQVESLQSKVADLQRALQFYCGVLGFELQRRLGTQAAFISAGGYHHHIGLNTWESEGGSPPPSGTTGLFHVAILYPTRADLADALKRLAAHGIELDGASDHGVSEALYLHDPDMNGIELYWDKPEDQWPRNADGSLAMVTRRLDLDNLINTKH